MRALPTCCDPVGEGASRVTGAFTTTPLSWKDLVRATLVAVCAMVTAPLWIAALAERRIGRSDGCFAACSEILSLVPGRVGVYLRRSFYGLTLDRCGLDAHIGFGTTLAHPQAAIGRGVYVGNRCSIGRAVIEDHATIGSNVDILSGRWQHGFDDPETPVQSQPGQYQTTRIGRNAWIGNSAVVMADVGPACVIGAGSVVVHSVPAGAVAVGNPAAVKRRRASA